MHNEQTRRPRQDNSATEQSRQYIGFRESSGDSMHNSNIDFHWGLLAFWRLAIRQYRQGKRWHQSLLSGKRRWPMRLHYFIWISIIIVTITGGALYHGQQDIMKTQATQDGEAKGISLFIHTATPKQWSDIEI